MLFCPVTRFWLHFGTAMAMAMFAPELERMAYERHRDWITRRHPPSRAASIIAEISPGMCA